MTTSGSPTETGAAPSSWASRPATVAAGALLAVSVAIRLASTFTRSFAQDDFFWYYAAWLRSTNLIPGRDYYLPNFTPLAELYAPLFAMFPESFVPMNIARAVNLLIGLALIWTVYRISRLLGANVLWALIATNILSWQHQFFVRIGDVRSDQVGALCLMAATIAVLDPKVKRSAAWSGFWTGMAIAVTYKLLILAPFIGLGALANSRQRLRDAIEFSLAAAVAPAAYFGWRLSVDGMDMVRAVWGEIFGALGTGFSERAQGFLTATLASPVTVVTLFAGSIGLLTGRTDRSLMRRRQMYALLAIAAVAVYVKANPFFFPYNFVIVVPILAPLTIGTPMVCRTQKMVRLAAFLIPVAAMVGGTWAVGDVLARTNEHQKRIVRWVWQTTSPNDAVFDWQGFIPWRSSTYHWWMYSGLTPKYRDGWFSAEQEIRLAQVKIVIPNYRLWAMTPEDEEFIHTHFVAADTCIQLPGWLIDGQRLIAGAEIDAFLHGAEYRLTPAGTEGILVNGKPVEERVWLAAGRHVVTLEEGAPAPPHVGLMRVTREMEETIPPCGGEEMIAWFN